MRFYAKTTSYGPNGSKRYFVDLVEQPRHLYLRGKLVWQLDKLTWTVPGLKQVWKRTFDVLDVLAQKWHERSCNDDCSVMYRRLPEDPPGTFPTTPDRATPACGRLPLDAAWDCKIFDIMYRDRRVIETYERVERQSSSARSSVG